MSDDASRRKLLKSITIGSGAIIAGKALPDSWHRPVIESVILPVHALTSGNRAITCQDDPSQCDGTYTGALNNIPRANALANCAGFGVSASGSPGAVAISLVIGNDGSISLNLGANTTISGNSFELEWQNTIATQSSGGTTCELWLVLSGILTPGATQILVQETWEWRCTGTQTCTNQFDAGQITLTLV